MANKLNIDDYNLDFTDSRIYVDFCLWLNVNPNGGIFVYNDFKVEVTPKAKQA
jgi:hypothetical protein